MKAIFFLLSILIYIKGKFFNNLDSFQAQVKCSFEGYCSITQDLTATLGGFVITVRIIFILGYT